MKKLNGKGNGKNGANGRNGKRDPFGPARRQRKYRQSLKLKKERAEKPSFKVTRRIHNDGSCTETHSDGLTIDYSPQQWTFICKCMAFLGVSPIIGYIEKLGEKTQVMMQLPGFPIPIGCGDKRWLKLCENDPNRDLVQIPIINK
jgi:hypothetical protein